MIILNTEKRVKVVPYKHPTVGSGNVILLPGNNDVPNEKWCACRENKTILNQIKRNVIVEQHTKVEKKKVDEKSKDGKATGKKKEVITITAREFDKLNVTEAEEIVLNTFSLKTLKKWKKVCSKDAVVAVIREQIEHVKTFGSKDKPKED